MQSHFIVSIARTEDLQPLLCLAGSVCFPCGMFINIQSDTILKNLRRDGETGYKIPYGGMFRFVSSPNYLGEIIEWIGFAMIAQTPASIWFALFSQDSLRRDVQICVQSKLFGRNYRVDWTQI